MGCMDGSGWRARSLMALRPSGIGWATSSRLGQTPRACQGERPAERYASRPKGLLGSIVYRSGPGRLIYVRSFGGRSGRDPSEQRVTDSFAIIAKSAKSREGDDEVAQWSTFRVVRRSERRPHASTGFAQNASIVESRRGDPRCRSALRGGTSSEPAHRGARSTYNLTLTEHSTTWPRTCSLGPYASAAGVA